MSRIILAGPFLWYWGVWHALLFALLLGGGLAIMTGVPPLWVVASVAALYTVLFLPAEIFGERRNRKMRDGRARTLSEFRQFLANRYGKGPSFISWNAVSGYSGLIDAVFLGGVVYQLHPIIGTFWAGLLAGVVSTLMALFLVPHFGWRHIGG